MSDSTRSRRIISRLRFLAAAATLSATALVTATTGHAEAATPVSGRVETGSPGDATAGVLAVGGERLTPTGWVGTISTSPVMVWRAAGGARLVTATIELQTKSSDTSPWTVVETKDWSAWLSDDRPKIDIYSMTFDTTTPGTGPRTAYRVVYHLSWRWGWHSDVVVGTVTLAADTFSFAVLDQVKCAAKHVECAPSPALGALFMR